MMKPAIIVILLAACAATANGQTRGTISGTVIAFDGGRVPGAPVQARDTVSGATFRTLSSATGEYSLQQLPAGHYDLSVHVPGFRFSAFLQSNIAVAAGQNLHIDITLKIGIGLDTLGDDPFTFLADIRAKSASLTGPVPRTADGHPDLSGVWFGNDDPYPEDPALQPWAAAVLSDRIRNGLKDLPRSQCLPAGVMPTGPFFRNFVQTSGLLVILNENEVVGFRQIYLDGRGHPKEWLPSWQGHAIGHWEGDTLVVDVAGFNTKSFMGWAPHSEQLRLTERYHRRDFGHMEVQVTADDPGALLKPWTLNMVWDLTPEQEVLEYVCTENIRNMHLDWRQP